jgi:6-phosphogluconolactonase (cycloisomerase 2 family)
VPGNYLLVAHSNPSALTVHAIQADGSIGAEIKQSPSLDFGIFPHFVRVDPSNKSVIIVHRGNNPSEDSPENPGSIKVYGYENGVLTNRGSVAPNGGYGYQFRHMDFHPSGKWVYVGLERQNKLEVYARAADGTLGAKALFTKDSLADPSRTNNQSTSSIHMHPNGRFVYLANRGGGTIQVDGQRVAEGSENSIAVFQIDQNTGEPTLIQSADTRGFTPRTFALDPAGRILIAANQNAQNVRDGASIRRVPAGLSVFNIRSDGKLDFVKKYDIDGDRGVSWVGVVPVR